MSGIRDQLANEGLLIRTWRDESGRLAVDEDGIERIRGGGAAERLACEFYLEHRLGAKQRSLSDLAPAIGRSLAPWDVEGTVQAVEHVIESALPREWRACTVVYATGVGVLRLREGVPQQRYGLTTHLPPEVAHGDIRQSARTLRSRTTRLREALIAAGIIVVDGSEEGMAPTPRAFTAEERRAAASEEPRIWTWPEIARVVGVSESTARRWAERHGLPVYQVAEGCIPWALRSELERWMAARTFVA